MKINLTNIGSHKKNIALFQKFGKKENYFIKEAYNDKSNQIIDREFYGYEWYFSDVLKEKNPLRIDRSHFYKLIAPQFPGKIFPHERKFHIEKKDMIKIIKFYKQKWPISDKITIHGDMALCNFIINKNQIYLIDWEHYHTNSLKFYGFDIINMLFISFYYTLANWRYISYLNKIFIKESIRLLFKDISFKSHLIERPFFNSKVYMIENYKRYAYDGFNLEKKFTLAKFPDKILNKLDLFITK